VEKRDVARYVSTVLEGGDKLGLVEIQPFKTTLCVIFEITVRY